MRSAVLAVCAAILVSATPVSAQTLSAPRPAAPAPALPAPKDVRYPGVLKLTIDATDLDRKIFWIKQTTPVSRSGDLVLHYPQWIPGNHWPSGPLMNFTGIKFSASGKPLKWKRDPADVYSFHIDVPAGVKEVQSEAAFVSAVEPNQGGTMMTPEILRLNWWIVSLYPAGHYTRQIMIEPTIKLPEGWDYGTALETASKDASGVRFKPIAFEHLIDSPLIAGKYFKKIDLDPGGRSRVTLNTAGDTADMVDVKPHHVETLRKLVVQTDKLYGARHFDHYDFLLTVSDRIAGMGLEHHRSSDNGVQSPYFRNWDNGGVSRDLLAHEYNHSWNGKFRRPADLWTPTFNTPMRDSLLWVYEGQTQFYGWVLAARAGFLTKQQALDSLAGTAATYDNMVGRQWRPLVDTTNDPIIANRRAIPWRNQQRSEDYYSEGQLIWLDVDQLIREKSDGKKSIDDFAKAFFGMRDGDWGQLTYTFSDVVATLNKVQPHDWATFLRERVEDVRPDAPLDGLKRGGYRLVYADTPTDTQRTAEARSPNVGLNYSIGITAEASGKVASVAWDSPAFKAGVTTAMTIVAVNGAPYEGGRLRSAVADTKTGKPVELMLRFGDVFKTVKLDYAGGLKYARLERIEGTPDRLGDLLAPK